MNPTQDWDVGGDVGIQVGIMLDKTYPNKYSSSFLETVERRVADIVNRSIPSLIERGRLQGIEEAVECVPAKQKECDCMQEIGYHTKSCDFEPYGWNACREATLTALDKLKGE